jgi:hypothetical protein
MFQKLLVAVAALGLTLAAVAAGPGQTLGRTQSTAERMKPERLRAVTEEAARLEAARQEVRLKSGLNDYRSILHAHAEDSAHTGGTRPEMLADAKKAEVKVILLSDHHRPPKDFITETWRGLHDGVLFIPGSEARGFLVYPERSIMDKMSLPPEEFIPVVTEGEGLIFLSHVEARFNHSMAGLTGMEIYNRHADAMDDMGALLSLASVITDPKRYAEFAAALEQYPDAMLATQLDYPYIYMWKWDKETQQQRVSGVAANDCHHNMVIIAKVVDADTLLLGTIVDKDEDMRTLTADAMPGIREMTKGRQPGEIVARLDFDPYYRSFRNVSTHILAPELSEAAIRAALKAGHAYVSHDYLCNPSGFVYAAQRAGEEQLAAIMGDELPFEAGLRLVAEFPVECEVRLLKNGEEVSKSRARAWSYAPEGPGVYRLEAWHKVDGEERVWIYANPLYLR